MMRVLRGGPGEEGCWAWATPRGGVQDTVRRMVGEALRRPGGCLLPLPSGVDIPPGGPLIAAGLGRCSRPTFGRATRSIKRRAATFNPWQRMRKPTGCQKQRARRSEGIQGHSG